MERKKKKKEKLKENNKITEKIHLSKFQILVTEYNYEQKQNREEKKNNGLYSWIKMRLYNRFWN